MTVGQTKQFKDVLDTLDQLLDDLERNPDGWENPTLPRYLDAMKAWLEASHRKEPREPSWDLIVDMLTAAKIYE